MNNQLLTVLLLVLIVAMVALRTVLRVRRVNRMRSKPRPDRVKPAAPIVAGVLIVLVFALQTTQVPASTVPSVLLLGAGTLLAALAGVFFTNRDLHQRAGDSWNTRRLTFDGAIAIVLYLVAFAGLITARGPSRGGFHDSWISPVVTVVLVLVANGAAWLWRRRHPTSATPSESSPL